MPDSTRAAVIDLLGVLAYGELTGFSRLATDAELAPTIGAKAMLARLAASEFAHYEKVHRRLTELGVDPEAAMQPFVAALDAFHERTAPSTWLEGLVKAYVGDGIASDFYREVSAYLDEPHPRSGDRGAGRQRPGRVHRRPGAGCHRGRPAGLGAAGPVGTTTGR